MDFEQAIMWKNTESTAFCAENLWVININKAR